MAAAAVVVATFAVLAIPGLRRIVVPAPETAYALGERADLPSSVFAGADKTVIVFGRSTCAGCQRAKPLLQDIVRRYDALPGYQVKLVMTGRDLDGDVGFARSLGADAAAVVQQVGPLRLNRIPTVLVVDRRGQILAVHEGILYSEETAKAVLASLAATEAGF